MKSTDFSKYDDILHDDQMHKVCLLCLTETHCTVRHHFSSYELSMSNIGMRYQTYGHDSNKHGGGDGLCVM